MPREIARKPRFIYPTIATSLSIAQVSALAELFFWRLLPQADDQGRLTGHPKQLKALACPMREEITEKNIPELLTELEAAELIIQYSSSSEPVIQIKAWWGYQSGMRRIYPSRYPPPKGWEDRVKGVSGGQVPTDAPIVPPKPEVNISSSKYISKPEEEVPPPTADEKGFLKFLKDLKGWRFDEGDDLVWLRDFRAEFPQLSLVAVRAARDYYSGRAPPKHKGVWKNRFRNWVLKEQEFKVGKTKISSDEEIERSLRR